jgi:hypothetical protein
LKLQVILVADTTTTPVALMSACAAFVSFTVAPARKFVPARLVMLTAPLLVPLLGVIPVTVGALNSMVNTAGAEVPPPGVGLNTVTFAVPAVATLPAGTAAVTWIADT